MKILSGEYNLAFYIKVDSKKGQLKQAQEQRSNVNVLPW